MSTRERLGQSLFGVGYTFAEAGGAIGRNITGGSPLPPQSVIVSPGASTGTLPFSFAPVLFTSRKPWETTSGITHECGLYNLGFRSVFTHLCFLLSLLSPLPSLQALFYMIKPPSFKIKLCSFSAGKLWLFIH